MFQRTAVEGADGAADVEFSKVLADYFVDDITLEADVFVFDGATMQ